MPLLPKHIQRKRINSKYATKFIYKVEASVLCRNKRDVKYYFFFFM